ncbi:MAG TPA: hypothetical protein VGE47_17035 [Burkholderiaceae bacterium]
MNAKLVTSALSAAIGLLAVSSYADNISGEVGYVQPAPVASTSGLTREAVQSAYLLARRNGQLVPDGEGADTGRVAVAATSSGALTRAAVRDAYLQALRAGELVPSGEGADIGHMVAAPQASSGALTRAAVRDAYLQALRAGELMPGGEGAGHMVITTSRGVLVYGAMRSE